MYSVSSLKLVKQCHMVHKLERSRQVVSTFAAVVIDVECVQDNPDEELLVAVGDVFPILARALGPDAYAPIFAQHHMQALLKWTRASQPAGVRAAGTGAHPNCFSLALKGSNFLSMSTIQATVSHTLQMCHKVIKHFLHSRQPCTVAMLQRKAA